MNKSRRVPVWIPACLFELGLSSWGICYWISPLLSLMPWHPSSRCSHVCPVPGIPHLGEILALGSLWGGWSGTLEIICLPASLRRCISKLPLLQVAMLQWIIVLVVGRLRGGAYILRRVTWCVRHTIGDIVGWWSVRNYQGVLSSFFSRKDTTELWEVTID